MNDRFGIPDGPFEEEMAESEVDSVGASPVVLKETWARLGIDADSLTAEPDGTLCTDSRLLPVVRETPRLSISSGTRHLATDEIMVGPQIAQGGMGAVWLGEQGSLRREVAIKTVRADVDSERAREQLLREARVTGGLEHPNIVPIHSIVHADDGAPLMVMKRVEGRAWSDLMEETRDRPDHLATHIETLSQVCHAVHFAHARGVLHRDLKPDNVMLGGFGEVYVVDWGVAVALRGDTGIEGIPLAADSEGIVGTLHYLAPEMAAGDGTALSARSDVYLLGAILHELLTGMPRHTGQSIPEILHRAWESKPPEYGPEVPDELADLARRATHQDPRRRPDSAESFRRELEAYSQHATSRQLAKEARLRLDAAHELQRRGDDPTNALREARFGYMQSLRVWPQNRAATGGLQAVLSILLRRAVDDETLDVARELLLEMSPEMRARWAPTVDALATVDRTRRISAEKMKQAVAEADLSPAERQRHIFAVGLGIGIVFTNQVLDWWESTHGLSWGRYLAIIGGVAAFFVIAVSFFRDSLFPTRGTRQLGYSVIATIAGQGIVIAGCSAAGLNLRESIACSLFAFGAMVAQRALLLGRATVYFSLVAFAAGIVGLWKPSLAFICASVSFAFVLGFSALVPFQQAQVSALLEAAKLDDE